MAKLDKQDVEAIAPDVLNTLACSGFFEKLDDKLSPPDETIASESCHGEYAISEHLLSSLGFDEEERSETFQVLQSKGGFCDCEILYNVVETSRLKSKYWTARADGLQPDRHGSH